jgi:hypothetical protein
MRSAPAGNTCFFSGSLLDVVALPVPAGARSGHGPSDRHPTASLVSRRPDEKHVQIESSRRSGHIGPYPFASLRRFQRGAE